MKPVLKDLTEGISDLVSWITSEGLLSVVVRNREKILFQGKIKTVSSENKKGPFNVLPQHANFISLIQNKIVMELSSGEKRVWQIKTGMLRVWENEVSVFLDILSPVNA